MKNKVFYNLLCIAIALLAQTLHAQNNTPNSITVSGSRFTYDLLRQWIQDFNEENPDVVIQIVPRETPFAEQADLVINAHNLDTFERRKGYEYIKLGRYVILPIANEKSSVAKQYKNKPITDNELKELYFDPLHKDASDEQDIVRLPKKSMGSNTQLYTRLRIACANTAFASYYGFNAKDLKGKLVAGEDKHLLYAIAKDTNGVTYSIPSVLYDLQTRKLRKGISILKTESLAKATSEKKLDLTYLDALTNYLEANTDKLDFPLTYFHISLKKDIPSQSLERRFIQYILTKGQNRLHEFGFLSPEETIRNKGIELVRF